MCSKKPRGYEVQRHQCFLGVLFHGVTLLLFDVAYYKHVLIHEGSKWHVGDGIMIQVSTHKWLPWTLVFRIEEPYTLSFCVSQLKKTLLEFFFFFFFFALSHTFSMCLMAKEKSHCFSLLSHMLFLCLIAKENQGQPPGPKKKKIAGKIKKKKKKDLGPLYQNDLGPLIFMNHPIPAGQPM